MYNCFLDTVVMFVEKINSTFCKPWKLCIYGEIPDLSLKK